jgi:hypothetical protein
MLDYSKAPTACVSWKAPQDYKNDKIAKGQNMSADQQLRFHQSKSEPLMEDLETWL